VASTGGVWSALAAGFGGMRDHGGRLTFDPRLPDCWPSLTWRMRWQQARLRVRLDREAITFVVEVGEPLSLSVRGERVEVGHEEVRVLLGGQGPRRGGGPQLQLVGESPLGTRRRAIEGLPATAGVVPHSWSIELDDPTGPIPIRAPQSDPAT
ncbi:MAG TPA: glycosyl hydrolase family 65 protein, partial [Intrasporangium sp.]|uniref:glycosyl hydrolase family 65 protein n=1 Tax=Intrasporangium sp. TaxID=1925024 RepID=UPI002B490842